MTQSFVLLLILMIAAALILLVLLLSIDRATIGQKLVGVAALWCCTFSLILGLSAVMLGTLSVKTIGTPEEAARHYYEALLSGDYELAKLYLVDPDDYQWNKGSGAKEETILMEDLKNSFSYEIIGKPVIHKTDALLHIALTSRDYGMIKEHASEFLDDIMKENIKEHSRAELYDEEGHYRQQLLDEVYVETLESITADSEKFVTTSEYDIALEYKDFQWKIAKDASLFSKNPERFSADMKNGILKEYLADNQVIRKVYKLERGKLAPTPKEELYVTVPAGEASKVLDVIEEARSSGLLEGQEISFNPNAPFFGNIEYYYDETILTILWKEWVDGHVITFCETKIGDASQFRRKIADDTYGSGKQYFATFFAKQTNAVVAMNADFYKFRNLGTTVYDRKIHRNDMTLDTLLIDDQGDFHFIKRTEKLSPEQLERCVEEKKVEFSLSFGPILVDQGELVPCNGYPIGETGRPYSRAGIGQLDHLHYLYMCAGHYDGATVCTVNEFAQAMHARGVKMGYNLDGGQTAEIVTQGRPFNWVDFGNERTVSDIIFFATALTEGE